MPNKPAAQGPRAMVLAFVVSLVLIAGMSFAAIKLTGGDGHDDRGAPAGDPTTSVTSSPTEVQVGESDECRVAATKWARLALQHGIETVSAAATAQTMNLDDLGDPTDTIEALCSKELAHYVLVANTQLAKANLKLSVCGLQGRCDAAESNEIQNITLRAMSAAGRAKQLINQ